MGARKTGFFLNSILPIFIKIIYPSQKRDLVVIFTAKLGISGTPTKPSAESINQKDLRTSQTAHCTDIREESLGY